MSRVVRRLPFGAEITPDGVHFRVWANRRARVEVVVETEAAAPALALTREPDGCFSGLLPGAGAGTRYRYRLDGEGVFPDMASRWQPDGPHGVSVVVDPSRFAWTDRRWTGPAVRGDVLYELHVGTFTSAGTWAAAQEKLPYLKALGVTCIEVMPIAEFPGRFGWGYDGVDWFAPYHGYGTPDDVRRFVDAAHGQGLAVILDVVYNHFGPDGNYVDQFSSGWFSHRSGDWGTALDFETPTSLPVRQTVIANAMYWIAEFHFDGLRLDATDAMVDHSPVHICAELAVAARKAAGSRRLLILAENEAQHPDIVRSEPPGAWGLDGVWNDDFHHTAMVALTGRSEAYFTDYGGSPQEFISAARWGYLYQGQWYAWQRKPRGQPARDVDPLKFIHFLENHDQLANTPRGLRTHLQSAPGTHRALTALLLLGPATPLLFQGQEFAASAPFLYFADHQGDLAKAVYRGRKKFLRQFPRAARTQVQWRIPAPHEEATFRRCQLDWTRLDASTEALALHRDLLQLRRDDPAFAAQRRPEGALLTAQAFVLRFAGEEGADRLLLINLGDDTRLPIAPEPLLAPPLGHVWRVLWTSEDPRYGGDATPEPDTGRGWWLPARCALVLQPVATAAAT